MLRKILDPATDRENTAFFMPSGLGPCRFGQYHRFHRMVLDEAGFSDVPIFAPDQSEKMYHELNVQGGNGFTRLGWNAIVAVDLIQKLLLQTRPYELDPGNSDRVYLACLDEVHDTISRRGDLAACLSRCLTAFGTVAVDRSRSRPVVGVVGEIYTRTNPFANSEVIRRLEEFGAEVWAPPVGEWIHYTSFAARERSLILRMWRPWLRLKIVSRIQHKDERTLSALFRGTVKNLHEPRTREILELARPYLDPAFKGEAVLSIGKSEDFVGRGAAGIVNVVPFTCMPGTIVDAIMKRFKSDHSKLPYLNLACDGQEQTAVKTRLEAFMHQVRLYGGRH